VFSILRDFRSLVEALVSAVHALVIVLEDIVKVQRDAGPALDRLNAMELSRHQFEAECQGILLKADGKLKAAANAEARERQLKKSYERQLDPLNPDSEEGPDHGTLVLDTDAPRGETQGMQPVRLGVETNTKAHAVRAKWFPR